MVSHWIRVQFKELVRVPLRLAARGWQMLYQRWIWGVNCPQVVGHTSKGLWKPGQTLPEVQSRGISSPTKGTNAFDYKLTPSNSTMKLLSKFCLNCQHNAILSKSRMYRGTLCTGWSDKLPQSSFFSIFVCQKIINCVHARFTLHSN